METEKMIYLVMEYASKGEIFGEYFLDQPVVLNPPPLPDTACLRPTDTLVNLLSVE